MAHILIIEDDIAISELIKKNLQIVGHRCSQIYDGTGLSEILEQDPADLIILDVMLPGLSGFELMKELNHTPVIFVTARGELENKLKGLALGAEDYIVKPFEILELIARVGVVLKRYHREEEGIQIGEVTINLKQRVVKKNGMQISLTPQEVRLLEVLIQNKNLALSREQLLNLAWNFDYEGETKTVDVHIRKLRQKLGLEHCIKTVSKLGYRLEIKE